MITISLTFVDSVRVTKVTNKAASTSAALRTRCQIIHAQSERSLAYLEDHSGPGCGGGVTEISRPYSDWTKMQLQSALDIAGVSYPKKLNRAQLFDIYKTYLEDEGADESSAKASSTPENSDEDSDDEDSDSGQDASDRQYFSTDRLRRNIVNDPKIGHDYPCSCGCERSYSGAEMIKCVQCKVVYVRTSCNKHRTCFDCAT